MNIKPRFRLLLIEDNQDRVELFRSWVSAGVHIVWAKSGGSAIGIIRRDPGHAAPAESRTVERRRGLVHERLSHDGCSR